jgi:hypothetical protein
MSIYFPRHPWMFTQGPPSGGPASQYLTALYQSLLLLLGENLVPLNNIERTFFIIVMVRRFPFHRHPQMCEASSLPGRVEGPRHSVPLRLNPGTPPHA